MIFANKKKESVSFATQKDDKDIIPDHSICLCLQPHITSCLLCFLNLLNVPSRWTAGQQSRIHARHPHPPTHHTHTMQPSEYNFPVTEISVMRCFENAIRGEALRTACWCLPCQTNAFSARLTKKIKLQSSCTRALDFFSPFLLHSSRNQKRTYSKKWFIIRHVTLMLDLYV